MEVVVAAIVGVCVALVLVWYSARAAITVCVASVRDGKLEIVRGGLAPRIVSDLRDIVKKPRVKSATIRVLRAKDRARLDASGDLSPEQVQRLRNVIGTAPLAQIANARRKK